MEANFSVGGPEPTRRHRGRPILVATAFAQPPQVTVTERGAARGRVVVPASLDTVRDTLDHSAGRVAAVANGAEVEATADGSCELEHTYMPHPIKSVTYTLRTCPTEGIVDALLGLHRAFAH